MALDFTGSTGRFSDKAYNARTVLRTDDRDSPAKRVFDLCVVAASAPILVPLVLLWALAGALQGQNPFAGQRMVGRHGQIFRAWTLRAPGTSLLRRTGLEAMPMMVNVLRGDMSLVGPAPLTPAQYRLRDTARYEAARPGLFRSLTDLCR